MDIVTQRKEKPGLENILYFLTQFYDNIKLILYKPSLFN